MEKEFLKKTHTQTTSDTENTSIFSSWVHELIIEMRGNENQRDLSKKLGYSFNQVGKWERGVKSFRWSNLFELADFLKLEYEVSLKKLFWNFVGDFDKHRLLQILVDNLKESSELKSTENLYWREVVKHNRDPYLEEILKLLFRNKFILISFLDIFVDTHKIPSLRRIKTEVNEIIEFIHNNPKTLLILESLKTHDYQKEVLHNIEIIKSYTQLNEDEIKRILNQLLIYDMIYDKNGIFLPTYKNFSFSFLTNQKIRTLTKYITQLAAEKYPIVPLDTKLNLNSGVSSVRVNSLSKKASLEILKAVNEFHQKINCIVAEDNEPKTAVQLMVFHSFDSRTP